MNEKQYVASLSYGKDSIAMLEAIKILGYPLDRIITSEVWFDDEIQADPPPMVAFKDYADEIIFNRYGIKVEHFCAMNKDGTKKTYKQLFYHVPKRRKTGADTESPFKGMIKGFPQTRMGGVIWCKHLKEVKLEPVWDSLMPPYKTEDMGGVTNSRKWEQGSIYGFPRTGTPWCNSSLKAGILDKGKQFSEMPHEIGGKINTISYIGIAADEPIRIARHSKDPNKVLPLVDIGWSENDCRKWCEENNLLSPIYATATRGGCWFCHNQGVNQLRLLRKNYPNLWKELLKLDNDSPVTFHPDGHTVHDFDERFQWEDDGFWPESKRFKWKDLEEPQYNFEQIIRKETNKGN